MKTCSRPRSSVLFDGHVPKLTGLDGDMWASQLLTINTTQSLANVTFNFTDTPGYDRIERVEVVMFNCPQWGIASTTINLDGATARGQPFNILASTPVSSLTSCESLMRVCLSANVSLPLIRLQFALDQDSDWVHLAEVTFYARNSTCPSNIILNQTTTSPLPACTTSPLTTTPPAVQSSTDTTLTSVGTFTQDKTTTTIIAVVIPLFIVLIIVIIVVVLILCIVCTTKHKHQLRAKKDHMTIHRQTHNHQPPRDRGHNNLCEETGQAYYSSLHDIQGGDIPADQVYNCLERDTGPVRGRTKSSWGATVDRNEAEMGAYSTVSYSKQPQASKEAAQVDEDVKKPIKKSEDIFATHQQEEASASALYTQVGERRKKKEKKKKKKKKEEDTLPYEPDQLYAQVDKKKRKKKKEDSSPPELDQLYAQVDKKKRKEDSPPFELDQLYAQMDKKKSKKKKEDSPPPELDQLYAQVDKKKSKKKKEDSPPPELDQLYAQVDKKKRKKREIEVSPQESGDVCSVVNKPSAPPVPLKSDLLMKELQ